MTAKRKTTKSAAKKKTKAKSSAAASRSAKTTAKKTAKKKSKTESSAGAKRTVKKKTVAKATSKKAKAKAKAKAKPAAAKKKASKKRTAKTASKSGKPKAKAAKKRRPPLDLRRFRKELRAKQAELLQAYIIAKGDSRARESDGTEDYIDYAVSSYDREFLLSLTELEQSQLTLVEEALKRISAQGFGLCVQCEKPIPTKRLEVQPWARYCLRCQELADQGLVDDDDDFGSDDDESDAADESDTDESDDTEETEGVTSGRPLSR